jgi:hypothetical protein
MPDHFCQFSRNAGIVGFLGCEVQKGDWKPDALSGHFERRRTAFFVKCHDRSLSHASFEPHGTGPTQPSATAATHLSKKGIFDGCGRQSGPSSGYLVHVSASSRSALDGRSNSEHSEQKERG